ncbi:MAG: hypothetical protein WBE76_05670, partial [Terracidiphilus sp.]
PASLGMDSRVRRDGLGGASPTTLQLNVPTHCMVGYTQDLCGWFRASDAGDPFARKQGQAWRN